MKNNLNMQFDSLGDARTRKFIKINKKKLN